MITFITFVCIPSLKFKTFHSHCSVLFLSGALGSPATFCIRPSPYCQLRTLANAPQAFQKFELAANLISGRKIKLLN